MEILDHQYSLYEMKFHSISSFFNSSSISSIAIDRFLSPCQMVKVTQISDIEKRKVKVVTGE
jgi:hypothetical protein